LTPLLQILSRHGHNDLPRDARTILNTPRPNTHDIKTLFKGSVLIKALISVANCFFHAFDNRDIIHLDLNIELINFEKFKKSALAYFR